MASPEIKTDISDDSGETGAQNEREIQSESPHNPIYLMARDCSELFKKCFEHSGNLSSEFLLWEVSRLIQEYQSRFDAWVSFLDVYDGGQACLDRRLQKHPALQDMIIRLLDIIRRNLFLVSVYKYEKPNAAKAHGSLNTIDAAGDHIMNDALPLDLSIAFSSIEEAITRLNKLGIAIRLSSRSTMVARARNFASQNPNLIRLSEFNDRAYLALQILYPNASESLRQQLTDGMTDRYARLRYNFYRASANRDPSVNASNSEPFTGEPAGPEGSVTKNAANGNCERDLPTPTGEEGRNSVNRQSFPQSSIDTSRLRSNMERALGTGTFPMSKPPKTLTVHTNRQREPPCPKFENGLDCTSCNWCFQIVGLSLLDMRRDDYTRWSDEGRRHYMNDLQPYVCIAEGCSKSRPTYSSSRDWFGHMTSIHSKNWSQNIQSQSQWACPFKHENDSAYVFSTRDEVYHHIHIQHESEDAMKTDDEYESLAKQYVMESLGQASPCPLCWFCLEGEPSQDDESDEVISSVDSRQDKSKYLGLHRTFSKRAETLSDTVEATKVATTWAMGRHIAQHLHYLMNVSLQLMSAIEGASYGEGDTLSSSGFPSSPMSADGREQLEDRLGDLPSEVQGSIDWSIDWSDVDDTLPISWPMGAELKKYDYSVAWICAISTELTAIHAILDETYPPPPDVPDRGPNIYSFGRIGRHNIVILNYSTITMGTLQYKTEISHMCSSFPNLRFGLMVGVGGGMPSANNDIRLGDIVISQSTDVSNGVVRCDIPSRGPVRNSSQQPSPSILSSTVASIKAKDQGALGKKISKVVKKIQEKDSIFHCPGRDNDRLFQADYRHQERRSDTCKSCDASKVISRLEREYDHPYIHYGIIATGDIVMRDGVSRDKISAETGALCFTMEPLMETIPSVMIRGICDYSDSHKTRRWLSYAALVAAIYAKELLLRIPAMMRDRAKDPDTNVDP